MKKSERIEALEKENSELRELLIVLLEHSKTLHQQVYDPITIQPFTVEPYPTTPSQPWITWTQVDGGVRPVTQTWTVNDAG